MNIIEDVEEEDEEEENNQDIFEDIINVEDQIQEKEEENVQLLS